MDKNDPTAPFLPTLERARAERLVLPDGPPAEERRLSALLVLAALLRREGWEEETEVGKGTAERMDRGDPPVDDAFEPRSHQRLAGVLSEGRCSMCAASPGWVRCRVCGGSGLVPDGTPFGAACSCKTGSVACPLCEGSGESLRAKVRYSFDRPMAFREVYVPLELTCVPALFSFEGALEKILGAFLDPPECLRCHDLRPRVVGTAYRGGERLVPPDFHGHAFGDTIDKATAALGAIGSGGKLVRSAIRAYAWPLLWLRYSEGTEAVLFATPGGAIDVYEGRAVQAR
jgi:hypothetical protein